MLPWGWCLLWWLPLGDYCEEDSEHRSVHRSDSRVDVMRRAQRTPMGGTAHANLLNLSFLIECEPGCGVATDETSKNAKRNLV